MKEQKNWAPLEGELDTQQWHANLPGWWLGAEVKESKVGKAEMKWWVGKKKPSWQLFDVSAFDSVSLVRYVNDSSAVGAEVSVQQVEA